MSDEEVTLHDRLLEQTYIYPPYHHLKDVLIRARKFVLDDKMSSFMTDLACATFLNIHEDQRLETPEKREKSLQIIRGARNLSKAPFPVTWVEFNTTARLKRWGEMHGKETYKKNFEKEWDHTPVLGGWIIVDKGSGIVSVTYVGTSKGDDRVFVAPFEWRYSTENTKPSGSDFITWMSGMGPHDEYYFPILDKFTTGVYETNYDLNIRIVENRLTRHFKREVMPEILNRLPSELRYVFTTMSTVNDIPTGIKEVERTRGFMARGRKKDFMRYSLVTIEIPKKRDAVKLARRVTSLSRLGRHEVRGHWRRVGLQKTRIWVESFLRGDASLGWVGKKYSVKKT